MIRARDKAAESAREASEKLVADAEEKAHIGALLATPSGKWILSMLIRDFEVCIRGEKHGHNSLDSYRRGKQDYARKYRDMVIRHFGFKALDNLELAGETNERE